MKEIQCPYSWFCGKTFQIQDLSTFDFDFVNRAISQKMTMMIIHCPKCETQFQFNPTTWEALAIIKNPNQAGIPSKNRPQKELLSILQKNKIELPPAYLNYITQKKIPLEISVSKDRGSFKLYTLPELCEEITIDQETYLQIQSIKGYLKSIPDEWIEWSESEIPFNELVNGLIIGYENTCYLLVDNRDKESLWLFESEDFILSKTNLTLSDVVNQHKKLF